MASALIVVDMLNTYEHEDADALTSSVERVVGPLSEAIGVARELEFPIVYVNDNYGDWSAGNRDLTSRALEGVRRDLVEPIVPPDDIPFVVKARHSIFYQTPLDYMLRQEGIDRLILTGQVTEQCVFYSALDGYVRHFEMTIPRDSIAHIDENLARAACEMMERNMQAHLVESAADAIRELADRGR